MESIDIFLGIWIGIGVICLIIYGIAEKQLPGNWEGVFLVLLGPLVLVWVLLSSIFAPSSKKEPLEHTRPEDFTKTGVNTNYEELLSRMSEKFSTQSSTTTVSRSDYANLQKLGNLSSKDKAKRNDNSESVLPLLRNGLERIDEVYKSSEKIAQSRKQSILQSIAALEELQRLEIGTDENSTGGNRMQQEKAPAASALSLSECRKLVKKLLWQNVELRDEILEGLEPGAINLSEYNVEQLIELGPDFRELARSLVSLYLADNPDYAPELCAFAELCDDKLADRELAERLGAAAYRCADSTDGYLALMKIAGKTLIPASESECLALAIEVITESSDVYSIVDFSDCTQDVFEKLHALLMEKLDEPSFWSLHNLYDIFQKGIERGFIDNDHFGKAMEFTLAAQSKGLPWQDMAKSAGKAADSVFHEAFLAKAEESAQTSEEKFALYEFFMDFLNDETRAEQYREKNAPELAGLLGARESRKADTKTIDLICQCAFLAAIGDGHVSDAESDELDDVRPILETLLANRQAVETLERTGDIEATRSMRVEHETLTVLNLFGPPAYLTEVVDDATEVTSEIELFALFQKYANRLEDHFARRLALWACREVAAADGLEEGEEKALAFFAEAWGLNFKENDEYFVDTLYPAVSDSFEYNDKSDMSLLELAKAADSELRSVESELSDEYDPFAKLSEFMGVDSLEGLARSLGEIDEDPVEDTHPLPPLFKAVFEHDDWSEVEQLLLQGEDPNQTINFSGMMGLPLLSIAAEHAPLQTIKALIQAGADVNHAISNPNASPGYQTPLVASLKDGGRDEVFDILIAAGANPDPFHDKQAGTTPLLMAALNHNMHALSTLLNLEVNVNIANGNGRNAFKLIASDEDPDAFECMRTLIKAGIDSQRHDSEGFAGIHNAVCTGSVDLVKLHLEEGKVAVDLPLTTWRGKFGLHTPLLRAMSNGHLDVVEYLLTAGASVSARNERQSIFTAISQAAKNGLLDNPVVEASKMLHRDAKPSLQDLVTLLDQFDGSHDAQLEWSSAFTTLLIEHGATTHAHLGNIDAENLENTLENAVASAPESTARVIQLLEKEGVDLDDVVAQNG